MMGFNWFALKCHKYPLWVSLPKIQHNNLWMESEIHPGSNSFDQSSWRTLPLFFSLFSLLFLTNAQPIQKKNSYLNLNQHKHKGVEINPFSFFSSFFTVQLSFN